MRGRFFLTTASMLAIANKYSIVQRVDNQTIRNKKPESLLEQALFFQGQTKEMMFYLLKGTS